ncbi:hypothetical protein ACMATS_25830 [Streptoverticillium reticulum]|uniref:hypothetical protein n=1 Tax=Streptoverticillium reticulum TaxID=1433415 RepID=UPI0039BF4DDA
MSDDTLESRALAELRGALTESSVGHQANALRHLELATAASTGTDAYAEHRALAFVHQWCFLIEQPPTDPAPLQELIGTPVSLRLSDGRELTTFAEISAWHDATAHAMDVTSHTIIGWKLSQPVSGRYDLAIDFAWQGISPTGQPMTARTHHEWSLNEDGTRLPRLASFVSSLLQPFAPATATDALADLCSCQGAAIDAP